MSAVGEGERGALRVVRGQPTDDEVAALVVAVATAGGAAEPVEVAPRSRWAERAALVRRPLERGPGAWRASGR